LANQGWDLWFGNNRGTVNSYLDKNFTVEQEQYWKNATFNEMGKYDVPANVDFILKKANVTKLTYIGHSQGTI
jgi:pimeloyl-ACP methyl ester carboxylesterase